MTSTTNLNDLLGDTGLADDAMSVMQLAADTLGPAITAGLGDITLDDINTAEVLLVTMLLDNSGSIRMGGNAQAVRDGHNLVLDALQGAKQAAAVLISCRYLTDEGSTTNTVLYPYRTLDGAERLTTSNYNPNGGTPLYDQMVTTLTTVAAKMAEFEQGGVAARAVTVIVSDGAEAHSSRHRSPTQVAPLVKELLRTEAHIIAAMGIDDGYTDFRAVFGDCGIDDEWILTPGNTPSDIRAAFNTVSQSAVRASQASGSFSQTNLGGFGS